MTSTGHRAVPAARAQGVHLDERTPKGKTHENCKRGNTQGERENKRRRRRSRSIALTVGLFVNSPAQAASVIDRADDAGNSFQANDGGDVIQPQFALWPLTTNNNSTVVFYESNDATGRGSDTTGQPFLLGYGAGNVTQVSTGGNVVTPQFVAFGDNTSHIETFGNWATGNGKDTESVTGGAVLGHVVDGNGNIFQLEFLQGNVANPQSRCSATTPPTLTPPGTTPTTTVTAARPPIAERWRSLTATGTWCRSSS